MTFPKSRDEVPTVILAFVYVAASTATFAVPAIASPASEWTVSLPKTGAPTANEATIRSQIDMMNRGDWGRGH